MANFFHKMSGKLALEDQLSAVEKRCFSLLTELQEERDCKEMVRATLAQTTLFYTDLHEEMAQKISRLEAELEATKQDQHNSVVHLQGQLSAAEERCCSLQSELEKEREERAKTEKALVESRHETYSVQQDMISTISELQAHLDESKTRQQQYQMEIESLKAEMKRQKVRHHEYQEELMVNCMKSIRQAEGRTEENTKRLLQENREAQQRIEELEKEVVTMKRQSKRDQHQIDRMRIDYEEYIEEVQAQSQKDKADLQHQVDQANARLARFVASKETLNDCLPRATDIKPGEQEQEKVCGQASSVHGPHSPDVQTSSLAQGLASRASERQESSDTRTVTIRLRPNQAPQHHHMRRRPNQSSTHLQ